MCRHPALDLGILVLIRIQFWSSSFVRKGGPFLYPVGSGPFLSVRSGSGFLEVRNPVAVYLNPDPKLYCLLYPWTGLLDNEEAHIGWCTINAQGNLPSQYLCSVQIWHYRIYRNRSMSEERGNVLSGDWILGSDNSLSWQGIERLLDLLSSYPRLSLSKQRILPREWMWRFLNGAAVHMIRFVCATTVCFQRFFKGFTLAFSCVGSFHKDIWD